MEHILDEVVPPEDLKKFEQKYHEEILTGQVSLSRSTTRRFSLARGQVSLSKSTTRRFSLARSV